MNLSLHLAFLFFIEFVIFFTRILDCSRSLRRFTSLTNLECFPGECLWIYLNDGATPTMETHIKAFNCMKRSVKSDASNGAHFFPGGTLYFPNRAHNTYFVSWALAKWPGSDQGVTNRSKSMIEKVIDISILLDIFRY